jgi:hypothetical protein
MNDLPVIRHSGGGDFVLLPPVLRRYSTTTLTENLRRMAKIELCCDRTYDDFSFPKLKLSVVVIGRHSQIFLADPRLILPTAAWLRFALRSLDLAC